MRLNWYINDNCGRSLFDGDGDVARTICIDGSILESLVKAYNGSLQWAQNHPELEIYVRNGKLYACHSDLPHEPEFEFELCEKPVATEIGEHQ